jgi:hypothetical protein
MSSAHTLFFLAAVAVVGCESPQDKAREANAARISADQKVVQVVQAEQLKENAIQQEADREVARLRSERATKIGEAEMGADRKDNEATRALWVERDQVRADSSTKLDGLDQEINDLRPKLETKLSMTGAAPVVADLQAKAAAVRKNIVDLDGCTADQLEVVKRSIQTGFSDLDRALEDAKKRV